MILLSSFSICRRCHPAKIFPICQRPWWWEMLRPAFYKELNCDRNDFIVNMLQRQTVWWCWSSLGVATLPRHLNRSPKVALTDGRRPLDVARLWRFWRIVSSVLVGERRTDDEAVPRYLQTDAAVSTQVDLPLRAFGSMRCKVKRRSDDWTLLVRRFRKTLIEGRWLTVRYPRLNFFLTL